MSDFNFENLQDDLAVNPETYPDRETGIPLPLPGNYQVKSSKWDFRKNNKTGELVLWKQKYPVIGLTTVEILDPSDYARKVVVFQDVPTMPFEREGKLASPVADLLRSLDSEATVSGTGEVIRETTERLNAEMPFKVRIDYKAYDSEYAKQLVAQLPPDADNKAKNEAYNKAKIVGYNNILKSNVRTEEGRKLGIKKWLGPSGNVCDVSPTITVFYPADEEVRLGPDPKLLAN